MHAHAQLLQALHESQQSKNIVLGVDFSNSPEIRKSF